MRCELCSTPHLPVLNELAQGPAVSVSYWAPFCFLGYVQFKIRFSIRSGSQLSPCDPDISCLLGESNRGRKCCPGQPQPKLNTNAKALNIA